jgi:hypothetical protein
MKVWEIEDDYPEELIGTYDRAANPKRLSLKAGHAVDTPAKPLVFHFDASVAKLTREDDLASNALVPLVSPRVQAVLAAEAPLEFQLLDAVVVGRDGRECRDYRVVVVTQEADCIDYDRSEYSTIPGTSEVMSFERVELFRDGLGSWHLARERRVHGIVWVSDSLVAAFGAAECELGLYGPEKIR